MALWKQMKHSLLVHIVPELTSKCNFVCVIVCFLMIEWLYGLFDELEANPGLTGWNTYWFFTRPRTPGVTRQIPGSDKCVVVIAGVIHCRSVVKCLLNMRNNVMHHTAVLYHARMRTLHSLSERDTDGIKDYINIHDTHHENKTRS